MIDGGLGSLIAESLTLMNITPSLHIKGLNSFVGSGKPDELEKRYMLDEGSIIDFLISRIK
jgi:transketolase C-terminal domain/subunit